MLDQHRRISPTNLKRRKTMSIIERSYPSELPAESVREIVRIVRTNRLAEERALFALAAWNVQGFLQRLLVGEPTPLVGSIELSDDEGLAGLEAVAAESPTLEGVVAGPLSLPAGPLLAWLVKKLLEALLSTS
jgi:hypothetical protein